jgi:peptide/nickel transport system substrate-binding protein
VDARIDGDQAMQDGRLNRREFICGAAALSIAGSFATNVRADTPQRGGHLIVGLPSASTADTLSPARLGTEYLYSVVSQFYDTLTRIDESQTAQPAIATGWETRPGAKEWIFRLRKGVTFHNGKEMTATDAAYSINFHRDKTARSGALALVAGMTDVRPTDKYELTINLESGNVDLPYLLADPHLAICPDGSNLEGGVGTGPFVLESFEPGIATRAKRNPSDWRSDRGYVDSTECIGINDTVARLFALLSGAVHLINRIDLTAVAQLEKNRQVQVFSISGGGFSIYPMRCDQPPFENLELRLAMKYAIDRERIVKTVLRGHGKIGNDHPIPSYDRFFAADLPQRPYDPDKAKFHYTKSGHSGPLVIPIADVSFSGAVDATLIFQASGAKAGVDIQLDRRPNDGYFDRYRAKAPIMGTSWGARPTPDLILTLAWASNAVFNEAHWQRPAFDQLLVAARAELDMVKRKGMYHDMQHMIYEDGGSLIPMFSNYIDGGVARLRGFVPSPLRQMSNYRAIEQVWFAS